MPYAFKDLMIHNSAIIITYRISLRSSSSQEPRYPLLKVVCDFKASNTRTTLLREPECLVVGQMGVWFNEFVYKKSKVEEREFSTLNFGMIEWIAW